MINYTDLEAVVWNQEKLETLLTLFAREYVDVDHDSLVRIAKGEGHEHMTSMMAVIQEASARYREHTMRLVLQARDEHVSGNAGDAA